MRIGFWSLVATSAAALLALAIRLKPEAPADPVPAVPPSFGSAEQSSPAPSSESDPEAPRSGGPPAELMRRLAESYGDPADAGTAELESDLRGQWQAAAQASHARRKAKLDREFAAQSFDGESTRVFRARLVDALKGARLDPALLSELECREKLCKVELSVPRGELPGLSVAARFRVESVEFGHAGDAGLHVVAYVDPTPPEPAKQAAAGPTQGAEMSSSQQR